MTEHEAGDRLARVLLPYCRSDIEDADGPDHEMGCWFTDAPPEVTREALTLTVDKLPGERPNDQPPEEWLVAQAERRGGGLADFVAGSRPILHNRPGGGRRQLPGGTRDRQGRALPR